MFDIKKVCHPFNVEEAKKYEGKKGYLANSIYELKTFEGK